MCNIKQKNKNSNDCHCEQYYSIHKSKSHLHTRKMKNKCLAHFRIPTGIFNITTNEPYTLIEPQDNKLISGVINVQSCGARHYYGPVHKRMNRVPKDVSERDSALSWFESLILPLWTQSSFQIRLLKREKRVILDCDPRRKPDSRTCECKALSERDSCVRILEMRAEAMHGSLSADCAVGTKYYLAVRRSCLWLGRRLQCLWTHIVQITIPITKLIAIRNVSQNVIHSFVNTTSVYLKKFWGFFHILITQM